MTMRNRLRACGMRNAECGMAWCIPQAELRMPHSRGGRLAGQALTELAIFGSFLLLLIGYLVSNVLQLDFQQQAKMESFRRAEASAASDPTLKTATVSTSHLLIKDRHMPNPSDSFGFGGISPSIAQGSVSRSYNLGDVPEDDLGLPRMAIQINGAASCPPGLRIPEQSDEQGGKVCMYTLAGFRTESGVPQGSLDRYRFIYGGGNICDEPKCGGGDGGCIKEETGEDPETGEPATACIEYLKILKIVDPCEGEIISKSDCVRQAAQIVDSGACEAACLKSGSASNCATTCSEPMLVPWYAQGASKGAEGWVAPALNGLFAGGGVETAGLQPATVQTVVVNNQLDTQEDGGGASSTANINVVATTERKIAHVSNGGLSLDTITSQKSILVPDESWSTSW